MNNHTILVCVRDTSGNRALDWVSISARFLSDSDLDYRSEVLYQNVDLDLNILYSTFPFKISTEMGSTNILNLPSDLNVTPESADLVELEQIRLNTFRLLQKLTYVDVS